MDKLQIAIASLLKSMYSALNQLGVVMKSRYFFLALALIPAIALAGGRELATKDVREIESLAGSSVTSDDYTFVYDASQDKVVKVIANSVPGGSFDASAISFSTALTGNPLLQLNQATLTSTSFNTPSAILVSTSGKSIKLGPTFNIYASDAGAAATALLLKCEGGNNIAYMPISLFSANVVVAPFSSAGAGGGNMVLSSAMTRGCPAGQSVMASTVGSNVTGGPFYLNLPYTVQ